MSRSTNNQIPNMQSSQRESLFSTISNARRFRDDIRRARQEQEIKELLDAKLVLFDKLSTLDAEKRQVLRPHVVKYLDQLVRAYRNGYIGIMLIITIPIILSVFSIYYLPDIAKFWFHINLISLWQLPPTLPEKEVKFYIGISILPPVVICSIYFLPILLSKTVLRLFPLNSSQKLMFIFGWHTIFLIVSIALIYYLILTSKGNLSERLLISSLFLFTTLWFFLHVFQNLLMFGIIACKEIMKIVYPVAIVVDSLILVLFYAERLDNCRIKLQEKQEILFQIEIAARSIEYYLPRRLHSGDIVTDTWMSETMQGVAAALREKKKWILTPKADTRKYFTAHICAFLVSVIEGNWGTLEPKETKKLSRPRIWLLRIISLLKTLFIACLPIIGFFIIQLTPWKLAGPIIQYVIIGSFIWILLTIIVLIDANFSTKLSALKDITGLFKDRV